MNKKLKIKIKGAVQTVNISVSNVDVNKKIYCIALAISHFAVFTGW